MTARVRTEQTENAMNFPCSCSTLSRLADPAQLALQGRGYPLGGVESARNLPDVLRRDAELLGDTAEEPVKSRRLSKLRCDTFKVVGQVEPLEYANNHIPDRIFTSREFFVAKEKTQRPVLAQRIVDLRKSLGRGKQIEFAQRLETDQGTVSKWESGRQRPAPEVLVRMAQLADGAASLYFLEEAGLPPAFLDGKKMLPELKSASTAVVARSMSDRAFKASAERERPREWDPELMILVIEIVNKKLRQKGRKLPDSKYAQLITLVYN